MPALFNQHDTQPDSRHGIPGLCHDAEKTLQVSAFAPHHHDDLLMHTAALRDPRSGLNVVHCSQASVNAFWVTSHASSGVDYKPIVLAESRVEAASFLKECSESE